MEIARKQAILDEKRETLSMYRREVDRDHCYSARDGPLPDGIAQLESHAGSYGDQCDNVEVSCQSARSAAPSIRSGTANAVRNTSNPTPGHPGANVEKDRCTKALHTARPKAHPYHSLNAIVQVRIAHMGYFWIAHSSDFQVERCATNAARDGGAAQQRRSLQGPRLIG